MKDPMKKGSLVPKNYWGGVGHKIPRIGWGRVGHAGVGWGEVRWVIQGWGGVGHKGVVWGGSYRSGWYYRGGVGHTGVRWGGSSRC